MYIDIYVSKLTMYEFVPVMTEPLWPLTNPRKYNKFGMLPAKLEKVTDPIAEVNVTVDAPAFGAKEPIPAVMTELIAEQSVVML
jgi:hypothetical protein